MRYFFVLLTALCLAAPSLAAPADFLPFGVTIGGQAAVATEASGTHAFVETPVASGAVMGVKDVTGQVIVNIFPTDENGTAQQGAQPYILLFDASETKSISANMQGTQVPAGWYLANVVGGGKTSRVIFQVK